MNGADAFEAAVKTQAAPALKKQGFKRAKLEFQRDHGDTTQFVTFQRNKHNTHEEVWFAVNLGVASKLLLADRADRAPTFVSSHWMERLAPDTRPDSWWRVVDAASAAAAMSECMALLENAALPRLELVSTNASLRDRWLSGQAAGLSEVQRLTNLHRVVSAIGPADRLDQVTAELERYAQETKLPAAVAYLRILERKKAPRDAPP